MFLLWGGCSSSTDHFKVVYYFLSMCTDTQNIHPCDCDHTHLPMTTPTSRYRAEQSDLKTQSSELEQKNREVLETKSSLE